MLKPRHLLLTAALLASAGCALDPTTAAIIGTTLQNIPGPPQGDGSVVTHSTGIPIITPDVGGNGLHDPAPGRVEDQVLDVLNQARKLAGVAPVTLDATMSAACAKHAHYLVINKGKPELDGLGAHHENPALPGYTPEGKDAGENADLAFIEPVQSTFGLINTLYHRTPMLNPDILNIGFAYEKGSDENMASVLMFKYGGTDDRAVAYPANGQTGVPLDLGPEYPDPVPAGARPAGYAVTLALPSFVEKATDMSGTLSDASGKQLPIYYSDDDHPATDFPQGHVICMIPKAKLKPGTTYKAHVSATLDGKPQNWDWSFTTARPATVMATDAAGLRKAEGKLVLVTGKVVYGGYVDDDTVFLSFSPDHSGNTSAFIPAKVWKAAGLGEPDELIDKTVVLRCTPRTTGDTKIELDIEAADEISLV